MKRILVLIGFILFVLFLYRCQLEPKQQIVEGKYLNHNNTVAYVGIDACKQCHYDKYESFIRTGMGSSFGMANAEKSAAEFTSSHVLTDSHSNLSYHPYWKGDSLYLKEYRLDENDTIYSQTKKIDFIVGSGQHTNSHIFQENGYLHQAPFTWYAQDKKLDLPPGYEGGFNSRFNRIIGLECTSCHNEMPTQFILGSENKYGKTPMAINCERCHGPGEAHIKKIQAGDLTDTSKYIDYSIVNPKKLSVELQFQVCQRCHLQGNAVLAEGKSFLDFKPGMHLKDVMDVYLPRFTDSKEKFIMASHVDRFKASKCFINSKSYTCTSCHNPHVSVKETNTIKFNQQCKSCHSTANKGICSASQIERDKKDDNCVSCHMPPSNSIDIPHVTVHDHFVRKDYKVVDTTGIRKFIQLVAINNDKPSFRSKAIAYLQQYERFNAEEYFLDSALTFLNKYDVHQTNVELWVHYFYLRNDMESIHLLVRKRGGVGEVLKTLNSKTYNNQNAWTAYRMGEAFSGFNGLKEAIRCYQKAIQLAPWVPDFKNKYGTSLMSLGNFDDALSLFSKMVKENPSYKEGLNNLGYCYLKKQELLTAELYFKKSIQKDPDYLLAWLNLSNVYMQQSDVPSLKVSLNEVLRIDPEHEAAHQLMQSL
jgi:tetratricopeptide (TPR) repeat protein